MAACKAYQEVNQTGNANTESREKIDVLRSRMELLSGKEKAMMEMYLNNSGTFRQMARLAGVNETSIARRIYKLTRRLLDGQYITCLHNRDKFSEEEIEIARDYFIEGLPMIEIADRYEVSYYRVRKTMQKIQQFTRVQEAGV
jgi:DNA-directed RNA polymerase specialized sigma subunit